MKTLIRLEELVMLLFSILIYSTLPFAWWWFPALILLPDVSMVGYLAGNRTGAWAYNFFHHKALALSVMALGYFMRNDYLILAGAILFGHSSLDRLMGYGLKYEEGFQVTHLGKIGKHHAN